MVSLGQSASQLVQDQLAGIGTNVMVVFPGNQERGGVRQGLVTTLTADDSDAIAEHCPSILAASPIVGAQGQIIYGSSNYRPRDVLGVGIDFPSSAVGRSAAAASSVSARSRRPHKFA
jgi:putative ABC transport system permease protein